MPTQWSKSGNDFSPADESVSKLPPGAYQISTDSWGRLFLTAQKLKDESLLTFDDSPTQLLVNEINRFWSSQDLYKAMGLAWRRGILMHGLPGTGKSGIIQIASRAVIANNGVVINADRVGLLCAMMPTFMAIEADTPMVIILEDVEELLGHDEHGLLQLLDGIGDVKPGILYIATTNDISSIPDRFKNRPSRFDTVIKVNPPDARARAKYLLHVMHNMVDQDVMKRMVIESDGFTFAHLKELAIAVAIYGRDISQAIETIRNMGSDPHSVEDEDDDGDVPVSPRTGRGKLRAR